MENMTPMTSEATTPPLELEPASAEVKRYQRQKMTANLISALVSLAWMGLLGIAFGHALAEHYPSDRWLRLLASAAVLVVTLEALTMPLDYYASFVLEHRYQLSNQTFAKWLWKRLKGYVVGG